MEAPEKKKAALDAVHLVDEGAYLVTIPWGTEVEIGGIRAKGNTQVVVGSPDEVKKVVPSQRVLLSFVSTSDGSTLSYDDHVRLKYHLLSFADEDEVFSDIDQEYAYKKFVAAWTPVYEEVPATLEPVEFNVTEVRTNSGDPDIVSLWNSPEVSGTNKALYTINRLSVGLQALRQFSGIAISDCTHSGMKYYQLDGKYVFTSDSEFEFKQPSFIGTLEQCKTEKERVIEKVKKVVRVHIAGKSGVVLDGAAVYREKIVAVRSTLYGVRTTGRASDESKAKCLKWLQEMVDSIDKQLEGVTE
jgi:hypothetical protein